MEMAENGSIANLMDVFDRYAKFRGEEGRFYMWAWYGAKFSACGLLGKYSYTDYLHSDGLGGLSARVTNTRKIQLRDNTGQTVLYAERTGCMSSRQNSTDITVYRNTISEPLLVDYKMAIKERKPSGIVIQKPRGGLKAAIRGLW